MYRYRGWLRDPQRPVPKSLSIPSPVTILRENDTEAR
jgi:hypothetical protein